MHFPGVSGGSPEFIQRGNSNGQGHELRLSSSQNPLLYIHMHLKNNTFSNRRINLSLFCENWEKKKGEEIKQRREEQILYVIPPD